VSGLVKKRPSSSLTDGVEPVFTDAAADNLIALIEELQKIDTNTPMAKLNETSIPDNNGGRINL
jgi:hypothetical protein